MQKKIQEKLKFKPYLFPASNCSKTEPEFSRKIKISILNSELPNTAAISRNGKKRKNLSQKNLLQIRTNISLQFSLYKLLKKIYILKNSSFSDYEQCGDSRGLRSDFLTLSFSLFLSLSVWCVSSSIEYLFIQFSSLLCFAFCYFSPFSNRYLSLGGKRRLFNDVAADLTALTVDFLGRCLSPFYLTECSLCTSRNSMIYSFIFFNVSAIPICV